MATYLHNSGCITPEMTSNTSPSPFVISASNETGPNNLAYRAFDQLGGAVEPWYYNSVDTPQWIKVDTGGIYTITSYTLTAANNNASFPGMPTAWTLGGSINDDDYTEIDSVVSELGWGNNEMRTFTPDSGTFRFFLLTMTAKEAGGAGWQMNEFELIQSLLSCYLHARRDRLNIGGVSTQNQLE